MWIKKKLFYMLLLFYACYCYAQSQQHGFTNTNTIDLWQLIDNNLSSLEADQNNMKAFIDGQGKQIESLENAYQNQLQLYLDLECKYQKSEADTRKWKNCSMILGTTTIVLGISTVALILVMVR